MSLREGEVRELVRSHIEFKHRDDEDGTFWLDELAVAGGRSRIDLAVVNCAFHGYEIKSDRDTLARLPSQAESYGKVFDYCTLVTTERHAAKAKSVIPDWWDILIPAPSGDSLILFWKGERNEECSPLSQARLLWRDELLVLLESYGCDRGVRSKTRYKMAERAAEALDSETVSLEVRAQLKRRRLAGWRVEEEVSELDA